MSRRTYKTYVLSRFIEAMTRVYGDAARGKFNRMTSEKMFPRPGRGGLVRYTQAHARKAVIAMELAELGIPIPASARLFRDRWQYIDGFCDRAEQATREGTPDVLLYIRGHQPGEAPRATAPYVGIITAADAHILIDWLAGGDTPPRFSATNLSAQLKALAEALQQAQPRHRGRPKRAGIRVAAQG
jgi:hypothetical protein